ncbi:MAG: hypothetical protein J7527_07545 [Chitinophagaceae bacterium]|nr:hypothetical protein [Chitinophagaceae bacterium]
MISSKTHGVLDYIVGVFLMASPWLLNFYQNGAETWIPFSLGGATLIYSLFTDYEAGLVKKMSMPWHLTLDLMSGITLGVSPWLFGFVDKVWLPHVIAGALEVAVVAFTQPKERLKEPVRPSPGRNAQGLNV